MSWAKLDDGFPESPKVVGLTDRAFRVHVRALCYAAAHLTDGAIPKAKGAEWGTKPVKELEAAGLWLPTPHGWTIHDYLDYNPSSESVKTERRRARERRANGGKRSGDVRANVTNPVPSRPQPVPQEPKAPPTAVNPVTHDQLYLAEKIAEAWGSPLSPAAIQKLNSRYTTPVVEGALRNLRGFPPEEAVREPFAYLEAICKEAVA